MDLYILDFGDRVKIGISSNVDYRVKKLELGAGDYVKNKNVFNCSNAKKIEFMLHKFYANFRRVGEYFDISYSDACEKAISFINKYDTSIRSNRKRRDYIEYNVLNRKMTNLYKRLGATYYGHLVILIQNMRTDNSIDYDILDVSPQTLKAIKKIYKENNIVQKGKLGNIMKYYVNPEISTYGEVYEPELLELFRNK